MKKMSAEELNIKSGYTSGLEWSMIRLPKKGEEQCGDLHLIKKYRDKALVAVMDGLGHGEKAAYASTRAKHLIKKCKNESLINIIDYCHQNLRGTRGVVMSLALVDSWEQTLTWIGVGNVKGVLVPGTNSSGSIQESIISRQGIVGYKLPSLQASVLPIAVGDILIFTTDGVQNEYIDRIDDSSAPSDIVEYIASNFFKESDDALIFVAKFVGKERDEETE